MSRIHKALSFLRETWLMVGGACLLLFGLEASARLFYLVREKISPQQNANLIDPRMNSEVYQSSVWRKDYFIEFNESNQTTWQSYLYWRRKAYTGKYINIDSAGIRKTYHPASLTPNPIEIFMFGGSTLWGTGARDDYTIPSCLAKMLEEKGRDDFRMTNFGEAGYVSTQQVIQLILELKNQRIPDVVIFYDGVNEVFSAFQNRIAGLPQNEENRRQEFNLTRRLDQQGGNIFLNVLRRNSAFVSGVLNLSSKIFSKSEKSVDGKNDGHHLSALADETLRSYFANLQLVRALSKAYGFATFFFWQPVIFSKDRLSPQELELKNSFDENIANFYHMVYTRLAEADSSHKDFHDLQDIFDERPETLFIDFCHLGEPGNQLVAEAILQRLAGNEKFAVASTDR